MKEKAYWSQRYRDNKTGWDIGYPSTPIKMYIDQLTDKTLKVLIPGAGNAYEAEYLYQQGFKNTYVLDISRHPLEAFRQRVPDFPAEQLLEENFFDHQGQYDLIIEQTFFCSFLPSTDNRKAYAKQMHALLKQGGKLVGLWFKHPLDKDGQRPFGGSKEEYLTYLLSFFDNIVFEDCYNSIKPRAERELFGIFVAK